MELGFFYENVYGILSEVEEVIAVTNERGREFIRLRIFVLTFLKKFRDKKFKTELVSKRGEMIL